MYLFATQGTGIPAQLHRFCTVTVRSWARVGRKSGAPSSYKFLFLFSTTRMTIVCS